MADIEILNNIQNCNDLVKAIEDLKSFEPHKLQANSNSTTTNKKSSLRNRAAPGPVTPPSTTSSNAGSFNAVSKSDFNCLFATVVAVLKKVTSIDENFSKIHKELVEVKTDLNVAKTEIDGLKKTVDKQTLEINALKEELTREKNSIDNLEHASRAQTVILSGPAINYDQQASNLELLHKSCRALQNTYNFDLRHGDVKECTRFAPTNSGEKRIKLSFVSAFVKDALIDRVIQKDKSNGINLNVNEFLSPFNSTLAYELRTIRKKNPDKIYATFTRNGKVFYKINQTDRAKLVNSKDDLRKLITDNHLINDDNVPN